MINYGKSEKKGADVLYLLGLQLDYPEKIFFYVKLVFEIIYVNSTKFGTVQFY